MKTLLHFSPSPEKSLNKSVVLIHGLFMSGYIMLPMAVYLKNKGFEVFVYDYATMKKPIDGHASDLISYLKSLGRKDINIVTHSLGGIITREMLCRLEKSNGSDDAPSIGNVVMLAPPHHGSHIAKLACVIPFAGKIAKPLPELSCCFDSYVRNMPVPAKNCATIAGLFDFEVRPSSTLIKSSFPHRIMFSGHTLMPVYPHVLEATYKYLLSPAE